MQIIIQGKNVEVTERLQEYVEKKVSRLDRYMPDVIEARVELSTESARSAEHRQIAQLTLRTKGKLLRAEERTDDIFTSIDAMINKMHRQIARYKGKRRDRSRAIEELPLPDEFFEEYEGEEDELFSRIVRIKRFDMVPMDEQEAVEQMELLGHDFFVFYNINDDGVNVLYQRRDGDYGLIQPVLR